jgi:aryl-alcohol dehydrogenase-like predicted oxidoreductase
MHYGVANTSGRPGADAAIALLRRAEASGVDAIDTAPTYGDSEELVARSGIQLEVFTKLDPDLSPSESIRRSLARLGRSRVEVLFLHKPDLVEVDPTDVIGRAARHAGELFESLGASTYSVQQFRAALEDPRLTTIQAPVSAVDQRLARSGLLEDAAIVGKRVVARSVYLQGALTLDRWSLPAALAQLAPTNEAIVQIARDSGRTVPELLLLYVRDLVGISDVLLGCETQRQLAEALRAFTAPGLASDVRAALDHVLVDDEDLLDARRWVLG